jgi:hypothetical protein
MSKKFYRLPGMPIAAFALAVTAAAMSGCNSDADRASPSEAVSAPAADAPASTAPISNLGEGHLLQGDELKAFLKNLPQDRQTPSAPATQSMAAPKSAGNPACVIDFNSNKGLAHMADRAYTPYAVSPFYIQPCFPYYALVTPSDNNNYYLPTEASGTCPGTYGKIGYGSILNCQNQQDAANFPRYAGNTTRSTGLIVTLPQDGINHNFRVNRFFARSGTITVYANRVGIGWWYWGPISTPQFFYFTNAQNVTELQFFPSDGNSNITVDNIDITGL